MRQPRGVRVALWLLRLHPRRFRDRYGREIESGFRRAAMADRPSFGLVRDAASTLIRSWRDEILRVGFARDEGRGKRRERGLASAGLALAGDARHAGRVLLRNPVHGVVTVLTLSLAIGANAAVFSVAWSVLLRTLPYDAPERTVRVEPPPVYITANEGYAVAETLTSLSGIESAATFTEGGSANLPGDAGAEPVRVTHVDGGFFDVLGARMRLGRAIDGTASGPEAVLSHGLWQRAFGGDPTIIGRTVRLSDHPVTVIGVAAAEVDYPAGTDVWLSYPVLFDLMGMASGGDVIARVTRPEVIGDLRDRYEASVRARWEEAGETFPAEIRPRLVPLRGSLVGPVRDSLLLLLGASALILLLGCVNLAGLAVARNAARRGEFVMRRALGAGRAAIVRLVLVESFVIAVLAGLLSLAVLVGGRALLVHLLPSGLPGLDSGGPGLETIGFVVLLVLAASVLTGLLPAIQAWLDDPSLPGAAGRMGSRRLRLHPALVVVQIALAVVLVISAGLLGRSVLELRRVPLGYDTDSVYSFEVRLPYAERWDETAFLAFADGVTGRLAAAPGVASVGVGSRLPLSESMGVSFRVWPEGGDEAMAVPGSTADVTTAWFDALGIRFLAGGGFAPDAGAPGTAIISRGLAESLFGSVSVVGRRVRVRTSTRREPAVYTIVGVVEDVRANGFLNEPRPSIYLSFRQSPDPSMAFAIRTSGRTGDMGALIRRVVSDVDPAVAPFAVRSMRSAAGEALAARDALAVVSVLFGAAALLLAVLGIYGLVAQNVIRRRREMGVRLAVGARAADLRSLVVRGTAALALPGITLGLVASFGATRLLSGFLFGVGATDGLTFLSVGIVVLAAALAAALGPAIKAARTDPVGSLRAP